MVASICFMQIFQRFDIVFLFGLAGSGKTYIGDVLSKEFGIFHYHADDDITPAMRNALDKCQSFTDQMRDDYFELLVGKIRRLQCKHGKLIVSQAVYKQRHRDFLQEELPTMLMVHISCRDDVIQQRLQQRQVGAAIQSVAALKQDFEFPDSGVLQITNNPESESISLQLERFDNLSS